MMAIWRSAPGAAFTDADLSFLVGLVSAGRYRDPERPAVRGGQGGAGLGRAGQPGQVHVPRGDEPRDPHADERHHRDERADAGYATRRGTARLRRDDPDVRRRAAADHQRHPRLLEDRGRKGRTRASAVRLRHEHRGCARRRCAPGGLEAPRARLRHRGWLAEDDRRRPGPPPADRHQPPVERHQVHRVRRGGADRLGPADPGRSWRRRPLGFHRGGARYRDRDPAGPHLAALPVVQPGRRVDLAAVRRNGPRTRDQPPSGRAHARVARRGEQRSRGRGQHVPLDDRSGCGAIHARAVPDRRRGPGRSPRPGRGRQRHQSTDRDQVARTLGDDVRRHRVATGGPGLGRRRDEVRPRRAGHAHAGTGRDRAGDGPPRVRGRRGHASRHPVLPGCPRSRQPGRGGFPHQAGQAIRAPRHARVGAGRTGCRRSRSVRRARASTTIWARAIPSASCWRRTTR